VNVAASVARKWGWAAGGVALVIGALPLLLVGRPTASPPPAQYNQYGLNPGYSDRFVFTRIRYSSGGGRRGGDAWAHDYPMADNHMPAILKEITTVNAHIGASNVLDLEDPEIYRNPILYLSEPGHWWVSPAGAAQLRDHLLKGGFIIFDDFEAEQWHNFAAQMKRVLPDHDPILIDGTHPIFDTFYGVRNPYVPHPLVRVTPEFYGYFEENDPDKRMMAMVNFNSDLAEYWEFSGRGFFAVDSTSEAYKLGVNYIIYGMVR
jgi:hypothetical protein